jgi:hypothetical protein
MVFQEPKKTALKCGHRGDGTISYYNATDRDKRTVLSAL